ncbi:FxSxx-COOH protein [Streptomyces ziwulingensis]|uniref:FxSxx-COOH protein n=1 Tax=Streptomyces ziwulingensis TaxID=1045501 RepID=A0ABP9CTW8_9ACTN
MDTPNEPGTRPGLSAAGEPPADPSPGLGLDLDLANPSSLPALLSMDLEELGTIEHPVLREVVQELRARAAEPSDMLWGFDNSF